MLKILAFKEKMVNSGFLNYPINEMDEHFYNQHGKPPSGKFAKMLTRATPIADDIWKQSLTAKTKLHDVRFVSNNPFTNRALEYLVEQYAALDIELQEFNKALKKAKQEQPLMDYYQQYEDVYGVNVFDMLSGDLDELIVIGEKMNADVRDSYPSTPALTVSVDGLKEYYKTALKDYKEAKKKGG